MPKPEQPKDEKVPDLGSRLSRTISSLSRSISGVSAKPEEKELPGDSSATGFRPPSSRGDLITLKIVLKYLDCTKQELDIAIHKSRDVQDVHQRTTQWLCEKFHFQPQEGQKFDLFYKNRKVDVSKSLKDAEITDDATIFV